MWFSNFVGRFAVEHYGKCRSKVQVVGFKIEVQDPDFNPRQQLPNISNSSLPLTGENFCCDFLPWELKAWISVLWSQTDRESGESSSRNCLIFGFHFPFLYCCEHPKTFPLFSWVSIFSASEGWIVSWGDSSPAFGSHNKRRLLLHRILQTDKSQINLFVWLTRMEMVLLPFSCQQMHFVMWKRFRSWASY